MNKDKITKFLAEQMGWETRYRDIQAVNKRLSYYEKGTHRLVGLVSDFDPMNKIEHAFMVEDAMDKATKERYAEILIEHEAIAYTDHFDETEFDYANVFDVIHASPKQRCIAAVKALADDEQLKEMGL